MTNNHHHQQQPQRRRQYSCSSSTISGGGGGGGGGSSCTTTSCPAAGQLPPSLTISATATAAVTHDIGYGHLALMIKVMALNETPMIETRGGLGATLGLSDWG